MPRQILTKDPSLQGVQAGAIASAKLPSGYTYAKVNLHCLDSSGNPVTVDNMIAGIEYVTVKADGKSFVDTIPAKWFFDRFTYYNQKNSPTEVLEPGVLPIVFEGETLNTEAERIVTGIGTANISDLTIEVKLAATTTIAKIDVFSEKYMSTENFGVHLAVRRYTRQFTGTGDYDESRLPDSMIGCAYRTLWLSEGDGAISEVTVWRDNFEIFQRCPSSVNDIRQKVRGRVPQEGWYVVDFGLQNNLSSSVPMPIADWRQRLKFETVPNEFDIIAEIYEGMNAEVTTAQ